MTTLTIGRVVSLPATKETVQTHEVTGLATGRVVGENLVNTAEQSKRPLADPLALATARLAASERDIDRLRNEIREELQAELTLEQANGLIELSALRSRAVRQAQDDIVQLARLLAERILGEELSLRPERVVELAAQLLREAAGANRITLYAPTDAAETLGNQLEALRAATTSDVQVEIIADANLGRGDLRVETDLGNIDGRIGTQLAHLASILVESIRS